jgi:chaperonin GroES
MSKVIYRPLGARVLIKPLPETEEDKKVGSILLSDSAIIFSRGTVLAVGSGEVAMTTGEIIPMTVKVDDTVLFRKECPHLPIRVDGEECRLVREGDIECVVE